eukprot:6176634-Pleurochrysis_carterae.AAC.1
MKVDKQTGRHRCTGNGGVSRAYTKASAYEEMRPHAHYSLTLVPSCTRPLAKHTLMALCVLPIQLLCSSSAAFPGAARCAVGRA